MLFRLIPDFVSSSYIFVILCLSSYLVTVRRLFSNHAFVLLLKLIKLFIQVLEEDSVFIVTSKRSLLDKCALPVGLRFFVSASHSKSDLLKAAASLKRVATLVLS
jgi:hypothetical protein